MNIAPEYKSSSPYPEELLRRQAIGVVHYFDMFDRPVTFLEIWNNLLVSKEVFEEDVQEFQNLTISDLERALAILTETKFIDTKDGFYFLPGKSHLLKERRRRFLISKPKWDRAVFATKIMRYIPCVRMVAVCNRLAIDAAEEESDIDVFIVTEKNSIWIARLIITFLIQVFGIRRHGKNIADRICLSFYTTQDNIDLSKVMLKPIDVHFIYYISEFVVLFERDGAKHEFFAANSWIKNYLPNFHPYDVASPRRVQETRFSILLRNIGRRFVKGGLGDTLNTWAKKIQMKKMQKNSESRSRDEGTDVIISDHMLKFHERDRRRLYNEKFFARLRDSKKS